MFKNGICNSIYEDEKLFKYAQYVYAAVLELEIENLNTCKNNEDITEALTFVFPRTFLQRAPQKAKQIIYDLDDIVKSNIIREELPPLHCYAMYQLLCNYMELLEDMDKNIIFSNEKDYLFKNFPTNIAEDYFNWIDFLPDDFVEQYDDVYIWPDLWEHYFSHMINNPQTFYTNSKVEQMLELMPNDIIEMWHIISEQYHENNIPIDLHSNIVLFKDYVENVGYEIFRNTSKPNEEFCRTLLQTFLIPRGFREAQMAGGRSDLIYPEYETILETKIWRGKQSFEDGLVELSEYLKSQKYKIGYYIIFDNNKSDNEIIKNHHSEIFDISTCGYLVKCVFVKTNPIPPSIKNKHIKNLKNQ